MATMTLDDAKFIARNNRMLPGRTSTLAPEASVVLADALTAAEAMLATESKHHVEAANARDEWRVRAGNAEAKVAKLEAEVAKAREVRSTSSDTSRLHRIWQALIAHVPLDGTMGEADDVQRLDVALRQAREAGFREGVEKAVEVVRTSINEQDDRAVEYRSKGRIEHGRSRDVAAYHLRKVEKAIRALAPAETHAIAHAECGRPAIPGDPESGPADCDCACRGSAKQSDCARAGCGFCRVVETPARPAPNPPRHPADAAFDGAPNYVEPAPKKPVFDAEKARDTMCGGEDGITPCGRVAVHLDDNGERTFACCGSDDCCGVTAGMPGLVTKVPLSLETPARPFDVEAFAHALLSASREPGRPDWFMYAVENALTAGRGTP